MRFQNCTLLEQNCSLLTEVEFYMEFLMNFLFLHGRASSAGRNLSNSLTRKCCAMTCRCAVVPC